MMDKTLNKHFAIEYTKKKMNIIRDDEKKMNIIISSWEKCKLLSQHTSTTHWSEYFRVTL